MQRIALYSHDALGLGHLRRNLAIARALTVDGVRSVLLVTGTSAASAFPLPPGVDVLTLPAFAKAGTSYRPRTLRTSSSRLHRLRAQTICAALEAFAPAALVVDKHPCGLGGELEPALEHLAGTGARLVLGLRDVLDEPGRAREEWEAARGPDLVRDVYTDLWVYGDRRVYDLVREVRLGEAAERKVRYTGYLGATHDPASWAAGEAALRDASVGDGRVVACLVGGGEDGHHVASAFARAELPPRTDGVIVTGPMMSADERRRIGRMAGRRMQVIGFLPDPGPLVDRAERIVSMGGYNTVCELLAGGKRSLVVPRVTPRREQLIRAARLAARGAVDMLHPRHADPSTLAAWLRRPPRHDAPRPDAVDLGGLTRIPQLVSRDLEGARAA